MGACCASTKNNAESSKHEEKNEQIEKKSEKNVVKSNFVKETPNRDEGDVKSQAAGKEAKPIVVDMESNVNKDKQSKRPKDLPNFNGVEDKDHGVQDKGNRSEKYKEKPIQQSEAGYEDVHNQHQQKIINYTNSNRSGPKESFYDNRDNFDGNDEIVENFGIEDHNHENKKQIVEVLDGIEDDEKIVMGVNESVNVERTARRNEEEKNNEENKNNFAKKFNVRENEEMSDFEDVTKGQNIIVVKDSQPKTQEEILKNRKY